MKFFSVVAGAFILTGCVAAGPKLVQSSDPYSAKDEYAFGPIYTQNCPGRQPLRGSGSISFLGADGMNVMSVSYRGHGWLFLSTKAPLDILIDGNARQLRPINSPSREVVYGSQVTESVYFPVTQEFAKSLAEAQQIQLRVLGDKGSFEQCLMTDDLRRISEVIPLIP